MPVLVGWLRLRCEHCPQIGCTLFKGQFAHHAVVELRLALRSTKKPGKTSTPLQAAALRCFPVVNLNSSSSQQASVILCNAFHESSAHLAAASRPYRLLPGRCQHFLYTKPGHVRPSLRQMATSAIQRMWQRAVAEDTLRQKKCRF